MRKICDHAVAHNDLARRVLGWVHQSELYWRPRGLPPIDRFHHRLTSVSRYDSCSFHENTSLFLLWSWMPQCHAKSESRNLGDLALSHAQWFLRSRKVDKEEGHVHTACDRSIYFHECRSRRVKVGGDAVSEQHLAGTHAWIKP